MLGGYPHISRADLRGSLTFLNKLRKSSSYYSTTKRLPRVLDCGAGIGRVTAGFLGKVAETVDVVEPDAGFAGEVGKLRVRGRDSGKGESGKGEGEGLVLDPGCTLGEVYTSPLQSWTPSHSYDLVWVQWCLGHLTNSEVTGFLSRAKGCVRQGGWIVVKENMSTDGEGKDVYDEVDSSVTRTDGCFRRLFGEAGLRVVKTEVQRGLPEELYPVRCYALQEAKR